MWLGGVGWNFEDKLRQTFNYKGVNRVLLCHVAVNSVVPACENKFVSRSTKKAIVGKILWPYAKTMARCFGYWAVLQLEYPIYCWCYIDVHKNGGVIVFGT